MLFFNQRSNKCSSCHQQWTNFEWECTVSLRLNVSHNVNTLCKWKHSA